MKRQQKIIRKEKQAIEFARLDEYVSEVLTSSRGMNRTEASLRMFDIPRSNGTSSRVDMNISSQNALDPEDNTTA